MRNFDNWNRYLDNNGKILYGCIQVMVKDGNTVADIYDRDGVALSNPQLTDNFGRSAHQIFVNNDVVAYFFKYIGNGTLVEEQELGIDTSDQTKWNLQYTIENQFGFSFDLTSDTVFCIPTMDALRATDPDNIPEVGGVKVITLLGYNEVGDKEPINYVWNPNSYQPDDNGSSIQSNGHLTGRWIMVKPTEHCDSKHFGIFPQMSDSIYEYQTLRINALVDYCNTVDIRPYFNGTYAKKYFAYTNLSIILKDKIDVSYDTIFIDDGTNQISAPGFNGDPFFKNHNTKLVMKEIKTSWNPKVNSEYTNIIIDSNPVDMRSWTNKTVTLDVFSTGLTFDGCDFKEVNDKISGTITLENMEIKQEWFTNNYDWANLTSINNKLVLHNFKDANTFITLKNKQGDGNYGDLNEMPVSNITLRSGCIAENSNFTNVTLPGSAELHNVSGSIIITGSGNDLNIVDCWLTIANTANVVLGNVQWRRGNVNFNSSYYIQVLTDLLLDNVDVRATFYTPGKNPKYINCQINQDQINFLNVEYNGCTINANCIQYPESYTFIYNDTEYPGYYVAGYYINNFFRENGNVVLRPNTGVTTYEMYGVLSHWCGNYADHNFITDTAFQGVTFTSKFVRYEYKGNYGKCKKDKTSWNQNISYLWLGIGEGNNRQVLPDTCYSNSGLWLVNDSRATSGNEMGRELYWVLNIQNMNIPVGNLFWLPNIQSTQSISTNVTVQSFIRNGAEYPYNYYSNEFNPYYTGSSFNSNTWTFSLPGPNRYEYSGICMLTNDDIDRKTTALFHAAWDNRNDPSRWICRVQVDIEIWNYADM